MPSELSASRSKGNVASEENSLGVVAKVAFASSTALLTSGYNLFVANIVTSILLYEFKNNSETLTRIEQSMIGVSALVGTIVGQIGVGFLSDTIGRRLAFITSACILLLGIVLSAVSPPFYADADTLIMLCIGRFLLGVGVGGEYPLAATISAEETPARFRGRAMAITFCAQGFGILLSALLAFGVTHGVATKNSNARFDASWRLCLALGAVPCLLSFVIRLLVKETRRFEDHSRARLSLVKAVMVFWRPLLGCAGSWFLLDVTFYANSLFATQILTIFGIGDSTTDYAANVRDLATWNLYLALIGLPGYLVAIWLVDQRPLGRKWTQLGGFLCIAVLYFVLGGAYNSIKHNRSAFLALYGLSFFFSNAGPNTTTFIYPAEVFPTKIRSSLHGFSAACGKLGAIAGTYGIVFLSRTSIRAVFFTCGGLAVAGALCTLLLPETSGKTLEELTAFRLNRLSAMGGYVQNSQTRLSTSYAQPPVPVTNK